MSNPYGPITDALKELNKPMNELLKNHEELVSRNLVILNNLKDLNNFNILMNNHLQDEDTEKHIQLNVGIDNVDSEV